MEGPRCREARERGVSSGRRRGRVRDEGAEGEEVASGAPSPAQSLLPVCPAQNPSFLPARCGLGSVPFFLWDSEFYLTL